MVHILETKYIRGVDGNMVINNDVCVVQKVRWDDTVLQECVIPILYKSPDVPEVSVEIRQDIVSNHDVIKIDSTHIHTSTVSYPYTQGEVVYWPTSVPPLVAVFQVPDVTIEPSVKCELVIENNTLHVNLEKSMAYHIPTIHTFKSFHGVYLDSGIIGDVFKDHIGELCKLHMEEDVPVCLEFTSMFDLRTRYYIASCIPDSE